MERKTKTHYGTVTEALDQYRKEGFTADFNIKENRLVCQEGEFSADDFDIADLYRYEGPSDPADEATVYAIESKSGVKGVLVMGYDAYSPEGSEDVVKKLTYIEKK